MENSNPQKQPKAVIWLPLIIGISIAIGIFIGNAYKSSDTKNLKSLFGTSNKGSNKIDFLLDYLNKHYVDTISTEQIVEDAIPSIISSLDPHSAYIPADEMISKGTELDGYFGGIGVEFFVKDDTINIVNVVKGGPSEKLGIINGDKIVTVNDSVFAGIGLTNNKVVKTLRGPIGSEVKIGIKRYNTEETLNFDVVRNEVPVKSVDASYMVSDTIGYIKISKFAMTTFDEFNEAVTKLQSQNAKAFIVDLRDNSGGALSTAYKLTNEFLNAGDLILYTEGRTQKRENFIADGRGKLKEANLTILINENSASASEILAGAIQDLDRGLIIGRRSFGKGLVQSQYTFPDESAIRITIARYHTPSGRCTQKPYQIGDREEYDLDILHRYERGEFYTEDSLKIDYLPEFKTRKGRTVYGDIGIIPDIFVPRDTIGWNPYFEKINFSGVLRDYSYTYAKDNKEKLKEMKNWEDAYKYLKKQPLVEGLTKYAFENKKIKPDPQLIQESKDLIDNYLMALIIRDVFSNEDAFYNILQNNDPAINKAKTMIETSKTSPDAIGEELYLLTKSK